MFQISYLISHISYLSYICLPYIIGVEEIRQDKTMAAMTDAQREALKNTKKATCWDSLQLVVVDVDGKPEVFSKTVDQVTASSVAPSALMMLNTGEVVKTKEDEHWPPNYKCIRKSGGLLAQVQTSLQFQEFQGKKITK